MISSGDESFGRLDGADADPAPTAALSRFAADLTIDQIPREVTHQAKRILLDTLGCMLGGGALEAGRLAIDWVRRSGGGRSTIVGGNATALPMLAAYGNGRLAGTLDADEIFPSSRQASHIAVASVAAALAVVEDRSGSGADLVTALVAGYEVGARISNGMVPPASASRALRGGWGPGSPLGATAAAGSAARLPAHTLAHALGIAGMHVDPPPLKWTEVRPAPMTKSADGGWHAMSAVAAVELAEIGTTSYDTILDGPAGLWRALGYESTDVEALTSGLGERWLIMDSALKRWPCQYWMHPALTALWHIVCDHAPQPDAIDSIVLLTNEKSNSAKFHDAEPPSEIDRSFSFPHVASMLVLGVEPGSGWFDDAAQDSPRARQLRHRVSVRLHPDAARWPEWVVDHQIRDLPGAAEVRVGATLLRGESRFGLGNPWSAATRLSDEQLTAKFHEMGRSRRPGDADWEARLRSLAERVMDAEHLSSVASLLAPITETGTAPGGHK